MKIDSGIFDSKKQLKSKRKKHEIEEDMRKIYKKKSVQMMKNKYLQIFYV